ncbi:hypothetical protein B0H14DRAFT_3705797 [Mycena olivaceomarginata]|nr:hypothetical protein B0H14DRAFT_3705797 [Mycena olivaceomarginata]
MLFNVGGNNPRLMDDACAWLKAAELPSIFRTRKIFIFHSLPDRLPAAARAWLLKPPRFSTEWSTTLVHISPGSDEPHLIRQLLAQNGAKEANAPKDATRIIVDPQNYSKFQHLESTAAIVAAEWVYSSLQCGVKRPSQYHSADPKLFFFVHRRFDGRDFVRKSVTKYGGQCLPGLTSEVTHLVVESTARDCDPNGFTPIIVSIRWIHDCLDTKELLPTAPHQFKPKTFLLGAKTFFKAKKDGDIVSAARRFCDALPATPHELRDKISVPSRGPFPFVPFELLAKIFIHFRDDALHEFVPSLAHLLAVSQVCSRWRDIAHGTCELWTHIPLNFHSKRHYCRLQKLFDEWATRSYPRSAFDHHSQLLSPCSESHR